VQLDRHPLFLPLLLASLFSPRVSHRKGHQYTVPPPLDAVPSQHRLEIPPPCRLGRTRRPKLQQPGRTSFTTAVRRESALLDHGIFPSSYPSRLCIPRRRWLHHRR
jgi:hypothetical protein